MTIEIACQCGKVLHAPESAIGRKGRCKRCGVVIEIAAPEPEPEIRLEEPDEPARDDFGINLPITVEEDDEDDHLQAMVRRPAPPAQTQPAGSARPIPPEPWFYGVLAGYATLCMILGIAQFVIVLIIAVTLANEKPGTGAPSAMFVFMSLGWMLGLTLIASPILLAVDAARNVRVIRYNPREGGGRAETT